MKARAALALLLSVVLASAQTPTAPVLQSVENDKTTPKNEHVYYPQGPTVLNFFAQYHTWNAPPLPLNPADRARSLIHNGAIYLSLYDAIALAIENNLDVEVARYNLSIAGTEAFRASGGGDLRGIDYTVAESPTGVGGPGSPLLNQAASSVTPSTPTVNDLTSLNILTETQTDLSVQGTSGYAAGPTVPTFSPTFIGQNTWFQRGNTEAITTVTGLPSTPGDLDFVTANYSVVEGFSPGTQVEVDMNNASQVLYGNQGQLDPFATPNTSVTVSQPLLRGRGKDISLRYIRIAAINQKISRLLFYQQLISTVYGVARLYYDLVSLNENARVKRESLAAAQKLYEDDKAQVDQGTLAPIGLTQAQSLVASTELDLIQSEGLVKQEEVILKSQLARRGTADPIFGSLPIVPTDPIVIPPTDDLPPVDSIVSDALRLRPDLVQASLQVESGKIALKASRNAAQPEVDLIGNFQTRGSSEVPFTTLGTPGTGLITAPTDLGIAGLRTSRIYQAGIQFNLPLKNHVAEADAARDALQVRQAQARTEQLENEVREEVESSVIALETARSALNAAIQSRQTQEQLVDAEKDKLSVGASTNFLVIQQESYLAQARSTEVAARSVWIKARVALDRAIGDLLEKNGITYDESVIGALPANSVIKP